MLKIKILPFYDFEYYKYYHLFVTFLDNNGNKSADQISQVLV